MLLCQWRKPGESGSQLRETGPGVRGDQLWISMLRKQAWSSLRSHPAAKPKNGISSPRGVELDGLCPRRAS